MTDLTELDIVARLGRDTDPPTADVRAGARTLLQHRISDSGALSEPARFTRPPRRRRRALTVAGVAGVGVAASIVALSLVAGPSLPGGLGARPASAETQLRELAARADRAPIVAYPNSVERRETTVDSAGTTTVANCTEVRFSITDSATSCDDGRSADPLGPLTASTSGFSSATAPSDVAGAIDDITDRHLAHGGTSVDADRARTDALGWALATTGLRPDTRAELLRLVADVPGLDVEHGVATDLGGTGDRFTVPGWRVVLDPDDGAVLEVTLTSAVATSGLPAEITIAVTRPDVIDDLDADLARLRDELVAQATSLEASYPPATVPGPRMSCATAVDPGSGRIDASAFGGWIGQHCVSSD